MKGMRIVIELRRDVNPNVILNNLYKHTQLRTTFGINMLALADDVYWFYWSKRITPFSMGNRR